jgi:hypothetical protein
MAYTPEQIAAALRKLTSGGVLTAEENAMLSISDTPAANITYTKEQIQAAAAKLARLGPDGLSAEEKGMLGLGPKVASSGSTNVTINNPAVDPAVAAAAAAKAKAEQEGVQTAYSYGISQALFADPTYGDELKAVYELFKAGNTGKALEELYKTKYYTVLSPTVKKRMKEKLEQPDVYKDSIDKYKVSARKRLVTAGVKINMTDFDALATQAYERGLDDNQFDELIKFSGKITGYGGNIIGDTSSLKTYANSFGVSKYLNQAYWDQKSKDLFTGTTTTEDIQDEIRRTAASAFPGYSDQINNGISVDSIASAYKGAMANILERDADSITFEDPRLRQALQYIGPDGKPAVKPLWQFERELRSTPEWEKTNNARDTIDSLSLKVLRDWGLA